MKDFTSDLYVADYVIEHGFARVSSRTSSSIVTFPHMIPTKGQFTCSLSVEKPAFRPTTNI